MKNKNPLYVVKGKDVLEANSLFDLVVKKFNLGPVIKILQHIFQILLEQVENFAMFKVVKGFIDHMVEQIQALGKKLKI